MSTSEWLDELWRLAVQAARDALWLADWICGAAVILCEDYLAAREAEWAEFEAGHAARHRRSHPANLF